MRQRELEMRHQETRELEMRQKMRDFDKETAIIAQGLRDHKGAAS